MQSIREVTSIIPPEIKSEVKIAKNYYLTDFFTSVGLFVLTMMLIRYVHNTVHWWFYVFMGIVGFSMLIRPKSNPELRIYQAILLAFTRDRAVYEPIDNNIGDEMEAKERGVN
ncbi:DUF5592 family protein [Listeria booriae]|uniref:PrgI family protein n=1 Tax=Listeria booriae TaxID=1552123 RepID=A0A7X0YW71_9LIST|nr:DUF5592 family protein [Listeria booriae]MBC1780534.1 hypothetical protein [Listeria booriae]MBC2080878.1 hypothetical protein [Listeria booriae]MBC2149722.1 hypothetical protein [Listeria booriae]MBC2305837.1 hypothetical protein [Listeria booriae]MBC2312058.1 hypothetical protein [Listeria booriae]